MKSVIFSVIAIFIGLVIPEPQTTPAPIIPVDSPIAQACTTVLDPNKIAVQLLLGPAVPLGPTPNDCTDHEVIIARGTGENGTYGAIVGDPLIYRLKKIYGAKVQGYAVQYPASSNIFAAANGATDVVNRLNRQILKCPKQTFALVGYSQGAGVMQSAAGKIPANIQGDKIKALVMFGDATLRFGSFPATLQSKLYQNCELCDPVCDKGFSFGPHLHYQRPQFMDKSVDFIVAAFKGSPLPAKPTVPEVAGVSCPANVNSIVTISIDCTDGPPVKATGTPSAKVPAAPPARATAPSR